MRRRQAFAEQALAAAQARLKVAEAAEIEVLSDGATCNTEFGVIEPAAKTCPKCGKVLPKHGAHFHVRACKE